MNDEFKDLVSYLDEQGGSMTTYDNITISVNVDFHMLYLVHPDLKIAQSLTHARVNTFITIALRDFREMLVKYYKDKQQLEEQLERDYERDFGNGVYK